MPSGLYDGCFERGASSTDAHSATRTTSSTYACASRRDMCSTPDRIFSRRAVSSHAFFRHIRRALEAAVMSKLADRRARSVVQIASSARWPSSRASAFSAPRASARVLIVLYRAGAISSASRHPALLGRSGAECAGDRGLCGLPAPTDRMPRDGSSRVAPRTVRRGAERCRRRRTKQAIPAGGRPTRSDARAPSVRVKIAATTMRRRCAAQPRRLAVPPKGGISRVGRRCRRTPLRSPCSAGLGSRARRARCRGA